MQYYPTMLRCSQTTATITFILIGTLFCLAGCAQLYKFAGLTDDQIAVQVAQDQKAISKILDTTRIDLTQIITTTIAGLGAIASGFLAKWLGTERKITASMIGAIEHAGNDSVKTAIKNHATTSGVEPQLHARVRALT